MQLFFTSITHLDVYEVKFGGVVIWIWGSSKIMVEGRGLVKFHDLYFVHFINFTRYMLQTCNVDDNQPNILRKSHVSTIF